MNRAGLRVARTPTMAAPADPKKQQTEWAAKLKLLVESPNSIGMKLMLIPPGDGITKPFLMGKYEVTQGEWEKLMGYNPSTLKPGNSKVAGLDTSRLPVESVNWFNCVEFCNKLSESEGLPPYYQLTVDKRIGSTIIKAEVKIVGGSGYKLPTVAEWTWACAAGAQGRWHYGSEESKLTDYAWYRVNSGGRSHAVGEKMPNAYGLHDVHSNVLEWNEEQVALTDPQVNERVRRGGHFHASADACAIFEQLGSGTAGHSALIGLRVARIPAEAMSVPDTDAPNAKQQQADWAAKLKLPVESTNGIGMKLMLIPPGEGVAKPFLMGKYEVTQGEWEKVMGYNPSAFGLENARVAGMDTSKFPVEKANWFDCIEFCNKLSEKEGLTPYYELTVTKREGPSIEQAEVKILGGTGYHIPTDGEWTWACAAGAKTKYHFGDREEDLPDYAWFDQNSDSRTHAVGEKKPNAFGLFDIHGNVREWNEEMLTKADGAPERVFRGGAWLSTAATCAVSHRHRAYPTFRIHSLGLRLARVPVQDVNLPTDASTDAKKQQADWAAKLKLPVESASPTGIAMVLIPPGDGVAKPFLMGKYEVTQGEWEKVMGYNPSQFKPGIAKVAGMDTTLLPVERVNWFDSVEFCNKLSEMEGLKPYYEITVESRTGPSIEKATVKILGGDGYKLPTIAEWTWACMAGLKDNYHFGNDEKQLGDYAWTIGNSEDRTHRVGEKRPNAFGLYDIHGNVREWNEEMSQGPIGLLVQNRGGSYHVGAADSAVRTLPKGGVAPSRIYGTFGLRIARVPEGELGAPGASDARKQQADWAAKLKLPVKSTNGIGMKLMLIPPGEGVAKPFLMGKYEVTQGEWEKMMGYNPSRSQAGKNPKVEVLDTSRFPVEGVNWFDAVEFCNKQSVQNGLKPYYELTVSERSGSSIEKAEVKVLGGPGFHLPTAAEWTWACNAGSKGKYHYGDDEERLGEYAWYNANSEGRSHPVGEKKPNAFGLYDLHGNVREWTEAEGKNNETGALNRLHRGGGWYYTAGQCTVGTRASNAPTYRAIIGFRFIRTPAEADPVSVAPPASAPDAPMPSDKK